MAVFQPVCDVTDSEPDEPAPTKAWRVFNAFIIFVSKL